MERFRTDNDVAGVDHDEIRGIEWVPVVLVRHNPLSHQGKNDVLDGIAVGLLHLVDENDPRMVLPESLGQHTAPVTAHISGRGTGPHAGSVRSFRSHLASIEHYQAPFEELLGQDLGGFGLPHAGRTDGQAAENEPLSPSMAACVVS